MNIFGIDFKSLQRSVNSASQRLQEMHAKADSLRRDWERANTAPTTKEDLKELLQGWVDSTGENYRKSLHQTLQTFRNPRNLHSQDLARVMSIAGAAQPFGDSLQVKDVDQALCALFAPLLSKALLEEVDRMEWPEGGMSAKERGPILANIEDQIAQLNKEIKELEDAAEEIGIALRP